MHPWLPNAFSALPLGIVVLDTDLVIRWANQHAAQNLRYRDAAEIIDRPLFQIAPALAEREPLYRQALAGERLTFQNATVLHDGQKHIYRATYVPVYDDHGVIQGVSVMAEDVTEARQAEQALRQANQTARWMTAEYERLFDAAPCMFATFTLSELRIGRVNRAVERILGFRPDELSGRHLLDLFRPESQPTIQRALDLLREEGALSNVELTLRSRDGRDVSVVCDGTQMADADGTLRHGIVALIDVSAHRAAEHARDQAVTFLNAVVENIPNMVFVKDARDLAFVRVNRAGEELLGHRREELYGKTDFDVFPKEEAAFFTDSDRTVLESGTLLDIPEESVETAHRGVRLLHTRKVPIMGRSGRPTHLLGISEDITEARQAQRKLEQRTQALEESNAELRQFAYAASHDLQEPLRTVTGFARLLDDEFGDVLGERGKAWLGRVLEGTQRMQELIRDLLEYSRLQTRQRPFERTDIGAIVRLALSNLGPAVLEANATVTCGDLPAINCDPSQLLQVFQNLIGNAVKFRGDAPPRVSVDATRDGDFWRLTVSDNGIGIDPAYHETVFELFRRVVHRSQYPGTGIGLAICARVVERHGGRIWVDSTPGKGSTFHFTLRA